MTTWIETSNVKQDGTPVTRRIKIPEMSEDIWFTTNAYAETADDVADILANNIDTISKVSEPSSPGEYYGDAGDNTTIQINISDGVFDAVTLESLDADSISTDETTTKEKPVYDVTAWGAVGDGATDDAPAIQDAIDAATAAGGGTLFFPEPETGYLIETPVKHKDNVWFTGKGQPTLLAGDLGNNAMFQNLDGANNVVFDGLEMDGSNGWTSVSGYDPARKHIYQQYGSDLVVQNCTFRDSPATSLGCDFIDRDWYLYNHIVNAGTDGETQGSNGIGVGLGPNGDTGNSKNYRTPSWAIGNHIENTAMHAVTFETVEGYSEWLYAIGNIIHNCHTGVSFEDCYDGFSAFNMVRGADVQAFLFDTFPNSVGSQGPSRVTSIGDHAISGDAPANNDFVVGADATGVDIHSPKYLHGITDDGTRTSINGIGTNAGDPSSTGQWNGEGRQGIKVYDTTNSAKYWYVNGGWV